MPNSWCRRVNSNNICAWRDGLQIANRKPFFCVFLHNRTFSPNFDRLYFSSQRGTLGKNADGRIYEVSYTGTDSRASA